MIADRPEYFGGTVDESIPLRPKLSKSAIPLAKSARRSLSHGHRPAHGGLPSRKGTHLVANVRRGKSQTWLRRGKPTSVRPTSCSLQISPVWSLWAAGNSAGVPPTNCVITGPPHADCSIARSARTKLARCTARVKFRCAHAWLASVAWSASPSMPIFPRPVF